MRRLTFVLVPLLGALALPGCSGSSGTTAATARTATLSRVDVHGAQLRYGSDIEPIPGARYKSDVVVIRHGAEAVRNVTGDGLIWTLDPHAAGIGELAVGKIMMATGLGVGRVAALRRTAGGEQIVLTPVTLTDVFSRLHLSGTVALANPLYYPTAQPAGRNTQSVNSAGQRRLTAPLSALPPAVPAPAVSSAPDGPAPPDLNVSLPPPLTEPGVITSGDAQFAPALDDNGLHLHLRDHHGNGAFDAQLTLLTHAPRAHFTIYITNGGRPRGIAVQIDGAIGVKVEFTAANLDQSGNVANQQFDVPLALKIPVGYGFYLTVRQSLTLTVQLTGRESISTHGTYSVKGNLRFGIVDGKPLLAAAAATVSDPLADHILTIGMAAGAVKLDWAVRAGIGVGLGVLDASAWYGLGFNAALAGNSIVGVNEKPNCLQGSVYLTGQFGISYDIAPALTKVVNAILSFLGVPKIASHGGVEAGNQLGPTIRGEHCGAH